MCLYLLDYGAGNVQSLANSLKYLGYSFSWITCPEDFENATYLIFPGVGAFETAVLYLASRGLLEPLKTYILSGRPYFGICIGMQVLFESSTEATSPGLGIIPCPVERFSDEDKSVPHIGWNSATVIRRDVVTEEQDQCYYFVHSYCAKYNPTKHPTATEWIHAVTQYGQEVFISQVKKGSIFATQFHPEKSGTAGLRLLDSWLKQARSGSLTPQIVDVTTPNLKPVDNLTKRVIACMDVRANDEGDLVVTKGDQYDVREKITSVESAGKVRNLGKPVALAAKYYTAGADEICLLNITSFRHSPLNDQPMLAVVRAAAETVFVPLTIGGGIKDTVDPDGTWHSALEVAGEYFRAGADKVSIGSEAVYSVERLLQVNPSLDRNGARGDGSSPIETIAHKYGAQAVVVSIDPKRVFVDLETYDGPYQDELVFGKLDSVDPSQCGKAWWYQCTVSGGREMRPVSACQLAQGAELLGAGELLLNSIDRDGTGYGFDLDLIRLVRSRVKIPVIASSGAGCVNDFITVFTETAAEAALAAGIFHREEVRIQEVKAGMKANRVSVRQEA